MYISIGCFLHCLILSVTVVKGYKVLHLDLNQLTNDLRSNDVASKASTNEILNTPPKHQDVGIHNCLSHKSPVNKLRCLQKLNDKEELGRAWKAQPHQYLDDFFAQISDDSKEGTSKTRHPKRFLDLTRDSVEEFIRNGPNDFADDYVDFTGIGRSGRHDHGNQKIYFFKPGRKGRKRSRRNLNDDYIAKKFLRTSYDSDSEADDSGSSSDEITRTKGKKKSKKYDASSAESFNSDSEEYAKPKPKKYAKKDPYRYMQAPTRIFQVDLDARRRLQHYLPKRLHWDEDDFKNLKNHWIHGPQGRYPGPYRIPF